ncbi:MAG: hypothetical protein ACI31G_03560 [Bacilli bacterium]
MFKERSPHYNLGFVVTLICGIIGLIISCFLDKDSKRGALYGFIVHVAVLFVVIIATMLIVYFVKN